MKRNILIALLAAVLAVSLAGCGTKTSTKTSQSEKDQLADYGKNASDSANMSKVSGTSLSEDTSASDSDVKASGKIGSYEIGIEDAKMIDYTDKTAGTTGKVLLVSFSYKNEASAAATFSSVMKVSAEQNEKSLAPTVVTDVEGFNSETLAQSVKKGEKITVQKSYAIKDTESPVTITVKGFDATKNAGSVSKTFKLQ